MNSRDFPLPISSDAGRSSAWPTVHQEPLNLLALVSGEQPSEAVVIDALSRIAVETNKAGDDHTAFTVIDRPPVQDSTVWNALIAGPAWPSPLVVWVEPARPLSEDTIEFLQSKNCPWVIGIETMLPHEQPHVHLQTLLRMIGRAWPNVRAVLNVNTGGWHIREELDSALLPSDIEAGPALTFVVHVIGGRADDHNGSSPLFAHTSGMHSTGRPELEMHGIAPEHGVRAASFLHRLAELVVEEGLPEPGQALEIGTCCLVRFLPAMQAAEAASSNQVGAAGQRYDHQYQPLTGERIAVCAMDSLAWPAEVAQRIVDGEAAMYRSTAATEREARLARATLDRFITLFNKVPVSARSDAADRRAAFLVKAGFATPGIYEGADEDREHAWFEVCEVRNGRLLGMLLNDPMSRSMRRGDRVWIDRTQVSGWRILTPSREFQPGEHDAADTALSSLLGDGSVTIPTGARA